MRQDRTICKLSAYLPLTRGERTIGQRSIAMLHQHGGKINETRLTMTKDKFNNTSHCFCVNNYLFLCRYYIEKTIVQKIWFALTSKCSHTGRDETFPVAAVMKTIRYQIPKSKYFKNESVTHLKVRVTDTDGQ